MKKVFRVGSNEGRQGGIENIMSSSGRYTRIQGRKERIHDV